MGRRPHSLEVLRGKGAKHLTKKEMREREAAETRVRAPANDIKCPAWLNSGAKREFRRAAHDLKAMGVLANVDVPSLAIWADAVTKHREATVAVDREGLMVEYTNKAGATNLVENPYVGIAARYALIADRAADRLGLTPAARARLTVPRGKATSRGDGFEEEYA